MAGAGSSKLSDENGKKFTCHDHLKHGNDFIYEGAKIPMALHLLFICFCLRSLCRADERKVNMRAILFTMLLMFGVQVSASEAIPIFKVIHPTWGIGGPDRIEEMVLMSDRTLKFKTADGKVRWASVSPRNFDRIEGNIYWLDQHPVISTPVNSPCDELAERMPRVVEKAVNGSEGLMVIEKGNHCGATIRIRHEHDIAQNTVRRMILTLMTIIDQETY